MAICKGRSPEYNYPVGNEYTKRPVIPNQAQSARRLYEPQGGNDTSAPQPPHQTRRSLEDLLDQANKLDRSPRSKSTTPPSIQPNEPQPKKVEQIIKKLTLDRKGIDKTSDRRGRQPNDEYVEDGDDMFPVDLVLDFDL